MNQKDKKIDELQNLEDMEAKLVGLSSKFMQKHSAIVEKVREGIHEKYILSNNDDPETLSDASKKYIQALLTTSSDKTRLVKDIEDSNKSETDYVGTGHGEVTNSSETGVLDELSTRMSNRFAIMDEYEKIVEIIPELSKSVDIIVRDIVNRDEMSNKALNNFYDQDDENHQKITEKIKDLLEEYKVEFNLVTWLKEAEIKGAKPISVLPQTDIMKIVSEYEKEMKSKGLGTESINFDFEHHVSQENLLVKSPIDILHSIKNEDISMETKTIEYMKNINQNTSIENFINSSVTSEIVEEAIYGVEDCLEDFLLEHTGDGDFGKDVSRIKSVEALSTSLKNKDEKVVSSIRNSLKNLVVDIDSSIEVVSIKESPKYRYIKSLESLKFGKESSEGEIDNFYGVSDDKKTSKSININKENISLDPINFDEFRKDSGKKPVMTVYDPAHVIPIVIDGEYCGYYIMEEIRNNDYQIYKTNTFADIIKRLGVSDDENVMNSKVMGSSDHVSVDPHLGSSNVLMDLLSVNQSANNEKLNDVIRKLMINVISRRLDHQNIVNNGIMQSAIFNFLKKDIFNKKKVRFSYVPESHMVYFCRERDKDGFPKSIFHGTLFRCYTYLSSLLSSLMMKINKSSDTEVMEVNIGKSKEVGLSIQKIKQNACTRNVSARNMFSGVDQIIKSVGEYKRIVIPVFPDGNKLFDLSQVEKANDVEIDDDFTERNLKSVIMKIGTPPTSLDILREDEFVASLTHHRQDYRNLIIDRQYCYSTSVTKLIRLLVRYSDLYNDESLNIDLKKIELKFNPPKNLTVNKMTEELDSLIGLIDNIVEKFLGEEDKDSKEWQTFKTIVKRDLIKELSNSTDWSVVEEVISEARLKTPKEHLEMSKFDVPEAEEEEDGDGEGGGWG